MRVPSRRALAHATGALALAAIAVVTVGTPSRAEGTLKPQIYSGRAAASTFHVFFDKTPGLFPITDIFLFEGSYATSVINSSGTSQSTAASFYPGGGILNGPKLVCGQFVPPPGCPFAVPAYPFIADANFPTQPDSSAETNLGQQSLGEVIKLDPNRITAHADPDSVDARVAAVDSSVLDVASADSSSTRSWQYFKNGALVTVAESEVSGLDLLGGGIHIDGVRSTATSTLGGGDKPQVSISTTITGATLLGQPITIDDKGISIAGSGDGGAIPTNVNNALKGLQAAGVIIKVVAPDKQVTKTGANASTSGLFVSIGQDVPNLPIPANPLPPPFNLGVQPGGDYVGSISIAGAGLSTFANGVSSSGTGVVPGVSGGDITGGLPAGGTDGSLPGAPSASGPDQLPLPGDISTAPEGPKVISPQATAAAPLADLTNKRLTTLALVLIAYPAFLLLWRAAAGLFGAALGAPSRLPRFRS